MIVVADPQWAEAALIGGRLPCPRCSGMLRPWASARVRRVRGLPDPIRSSRGGLAARDVSGPRYFRPGRCSPAGRRHRGGGQGAGRQGRWGGYRRIAADLDRPLSTVRRWLRVAGTPGHADRLRHQANHLIFRIDGDILNRIGPEAVRWPAR
jgi:hypothetical protein